MDFTTVLQKFFDPLGWFLTLGKDDAKQVRDALEDLILHTSASLKSFVELRDVLEEVPKTSFDQTTFAKTIYFPCTANLTGSDAALKARTHCTDIARDINRINFKVSKYLRTENMDWKGINEAFLELVNADMTFLNDFEELMKQVDQELRTIYELLGVKIDVIKKEEAWTRYQTLRTSLHDQDQRLRETLERLRSAQTHVRQLLT